MLYCVLFEIFFLVVNRSIRYLRGSPGTYLISQKPSVIATENVISIVIMYILISNAYPKL